MKESTTFPDRFLRMVPPQNLEAESSVLGAILIEPEAINLACELLKPEDFYRESHRKIFRAMIELRNRSEPIDLIQLSECLKNRGEIDALGGSAYLASLADFTPTAANIASYARIVRDKAKLRSVISTATEILDRGYEEQGNVEEFFDTAKKAFAFLENGHADDQEHKVELYLAPQAFHGLAGDIVRTIRPYSEADDAALLVNTLAAFGSVSGASSHAVVNHDGHPGRLFVVQVGPTAKGRKGTGWSPIKYLFSMVDREWSKDRVKTGLSTGEGLIFNVRDPIYKQEPIKEKGRVIDYQQVMVDPGQRDKRLLVIEPEFAATLTVMGREGNTLSAIMRQAWDSGDLSPLTKNNPITATGANVSIISHITQQELLARMDDTSKANGFANRFLWVIVKRSKELPEGADVPDILLQELAEKLTTAVDHARKGGVVVRDPLAKEAWAKVYGPLSAGRPGLTGAILSRAEAQVLRLSVLYALLDCKRTVSVEHLKAALALWEYCEASAELIFGTKLGYPDADRILEALRDVGETGMADWDMHGLFAGNRSAGDRGRALAFLKELRLVKSETIPTKGRPKTIWKATQ